MTIERFLLPLVFIIAVLVGTLCVPREADALSIPEHYQHLMAVFFWPAEIPTVTALIECESGWDTQAKNPVTTASGLSQITRPTWRDLRERLDAPLRPHAEAVWWPHQHFYAMRLLIDERGYQPWNASASCWR